MQEGRWKVTWKLKTGCTRIQLCGTVDDLIEAVLEALEYPEHQMTIEDLERKQPNVPDQRPPTGDVGLAEGAIGGSLHPVVGHHGQSGTKL